MSEKVDKYVDEEIESESDVEIDPDVDDDDESFMDSDDENDKTEKIFKKTTGGVDDDYDVDDEIDDDEIEETSDDYDDNYLKKFDKSLKSRVISQYHPELKTKSYEEILSLSNIIRDDAGNIVDPLHKTLGILTKYEYTRVLGERAKQLSIGAEPFVKVDDYIVDEYSIAKIELTEKKIPFIIERPLPNGTMEYWRLEDLEILN